ncbi:MAG: hypothetical protein K5854_08335 [Prevotella sp.]|nr:hypothetical protein [Prevotella sp.]
MDKNNEIADGIVLTPEEWKELFDEPYHVYGNMTWDEFLAWDNDEKEDYFSLSDVFEAYYTCRRHKRGTVNAIRFEMFWESNCISLWEELNDGTYQPGRSIAFVVVEPKPREVFAATFRDRIVHHLITNELQPIFEMIFVDNSYSTRPCKGILYGINHVAWQLEHITENYTAKECYIMKLDVKGFFMHIDKRIMFSMLKQVMLRRYRGKNLNKMIELIRIVVFHRPELNFRNKSPLWKWQLLPKEKSLFTADGMHGLPIGNITSQLFALLFMNHLDKCIIRKHPNVGYGRYVDDIIVIGKDKQELLNVREEIRQWLQKRGMTLHHDKMYLQHYKHGVAFIGGIVKPWRKYIGERTVRRAENMISYYNQLACRRADMVFEKGFEFAERLNSYIGFLRHYDEYRLMRRLIGDVSSKWFDVMKFKMKGRRGKAVLKPSFKQWMLAKVDAENNEHDLD